jgi:acetyl esterase/lipase
MLMALPNTPSPFIFFPALQYGEAPDMPPWAASLYLDMLHPSPLLKTPAPAVIYLHGGGWSEGTRISGLQPWLNPLLAAHGFITVSLRTCQGITLSITASEAVAALRGRMV